MNYIAQVDSIICTGILSGTYACSIIDIRKIQNTSLIGLFTKAKFPTVLSFKWLPLFRNFVVQLQSHATYNFESCFS